MTQPQPQPPHGPNPFSFQNSRRSVRVKLVQHIQAWYLKTSSTNFNHHQTKGYKYPWKIEWDLTNRPLSKVLEILDTQV